MKEKVFSKVFKISPGEHTPRPPPFMWAGWHGIQLLKKLAMPRTDFARCSLQREYLGGLVWDQVPESQIVVKLKILDKHTCKEKDIQNNNTK